MFSAAFALILIWGVIGGGLMHKKYHHCCCCCDYSCLLLFSDPDITCSTTTMTTVSSTTATTTGTSTIAHYCCQNYYCFYCCWCFVSSNVADVSPDWVWKSCSFARCKISVLSERGVWLIKNYFYVDMLDPLFFFSILCCGHYKTFYGIKC